MTSYRVLKPILLNAKLEGHTSDITSVDYSDGVLASSSADKSIRLWFMSSEGLFSEPSYSPLLGHTYGVNCVRFAPFGKMLASCSTDGKVILWNVTDGGKVGEVQHDNGSPIRVCAFSPTSNLFATGGDDEKVILWDIATKTIVSVFRGHHAMVTALAFSPDSLFLISCSTAGDILLWDGRFGHGKFLSSISDAHDLGVLGCDFSPQYEASAERGCLSGNYTVATCGNDDLIKLWFIKTGSTKSISLITQLQGHTRSVMSCRFSPDGTWLASTGGDNHAILWNPNTSEPLLKLDGHDRYVTCCVFVAGSIVATGSNDKNVCVWSLEKGKLVNLYKELGINPGTGSIVNKKKQSTLSWSVTDVINWLEKIKLEDLVPTFLANDIDGEELMLLTHERLTTNLKIESFGQRNKILRAMQCLKNPLWHHAFSDLSDEMALQEFFCPITHEVMIDPVVASDGYTYERIAIEEWFENGRETSPMTNGVLPDKNLIPNYVLLQLIRKYK